MENQTETANSAIVLHPAWPVRIQYYLLRTNIVFFYIYIFLSVILLIAGRFSMMHFYTFIMMLSVAGGSYWLCWLYRKRRKLFMTILRGFFYLAFLTFFLTLFSKSWFLIVSTLPGLAWTSYFMFSKNPKTSDYFQF